MEFLSSFFLAPRSGSRAQFATRMIASILPIGLVVLNAHLCDQRRSSSKATSSDWKSLARTTVFLWMFTYLVYRQKFTWLNTLILSGYSLILTFFGFYAYFKWDFLRSHVPTDCNDYIVDTVSLWGVFYLVIDIFSENNRCSRITYD